MMKYPQLPDIWHQIVKTFEVNAPTPQQMEVSARTPPPPPPPNAGSASTT